jgi:hypothetical protein
LRLVLTAYSIALSLLRAKSRMRDLAAVGASPFGGHATVEHAKAITDVTRLETATWSLSGCLSRCELGKNIHLVTMRLVLRNGTQTIRTAPWNWHALHGQTLKAAQVRTWTAARDDRSHDDQSHHVAARRLTSQAFPLRRSRTRARPEGDA